MPQGAEPVGQGQPAQPAGKNPPPDEGKPAEEKPGFQEGRGRSGKPVTCVRTKIPLECQIEVIRFSTSKGEYVISKQLWDFILSAEGYKAQPYVPTGSS